MPMAMEEVGEALLDARPDAFRVTLLPDFFLDHFVPLPDLKQAVGEIERVHAQGGGNLRVPEQGLAPGGNAANAALALARMGVGATLVTRTSPFGAEFLRASLGREGVDLSRVREDGVMAVTTALEFPRANVMLSTPGSAGDFGPEVLGGGDWDRIRESDAVVVTNWQNRHATALATEVCRVARQAGVRTFVDTGDPSASGGSVQEFLDRVVPSADVDALGVNENELRHYQAPRGDDAGSLVEAAERFSERAGARIDLHTSAFSASFRDGKRLAVTPTFDLRLRRATGCGDAWNAGNLLGDLLGLTDGGRLLVANAVAAAYGASVEARHLPLEALSRFMGETPLRALPPGLTSAP